VPFFGPMKMRDIMPEQVREWVTWMKDKGASAVTIEYSKGSVLNAIFTTALDDEIIGIHPSHGVKIPANPAKPRRIITPAQFDRLYQALPDADAQLLVETDIESGLRWGELTELRTHDLDFATGILTISRAVVELTPDEHPSGGRFLVKDYPKDKEYRRFKLSQQIVAKIHAHVTANGIGDDDLLFTYHPPAQSRTRRADLSAAPPPGMTEPNEKGRQYRHGTLTAYNAAKCRCEYCRGAYADYRARRRADGEDHPRTPKVRDTDGHILADWFRHQVWSPARKAAGLEQVRVHDLRHAHAGLYAWALHHRLTGWQAMSWPAEIDVFLAVGELALYVAYLDGWPARQRTWPWATTGVGLVVSVAGNVGHIQPLPGHPVLVADRLTAAASPLAAFAGLTVGLLVLRMNRLCSAAACTLPGELVPPSGVLAANPTGHPAEDARPPAAGGPLPQRQSANGHGGSAPVVSQKSGLLEDAVVICKTAAARGERLSQRGLARTLRGRGHRFPNQSLHDIAMAVELPAPPRPATAASR
jgi:integrase